MKCTVKMGSDGMLYIPSFMMIRKGDDGMLRFGRSKFERL
jgi:hypothetical protein